MCKWGDDVLLRVKMSAKKSYTGKERWAYRGIDKCIAPIIKTLNEADIFTDECCCGHGKLEGYIALHDGRVMVILPDKKTWDKYRNLTKVFPIIGE